MKLRFVVGLLVSLSGCFRISYRQQLPNDGETRVHVQHYGGLFALEAKASPIHLETFCPQGFARVQSVKTFEDSFNGQVLSSRIQCTAAPAPAAAVLSNSL